MNDFEARRAARIERLHDRADRKEGEASRLHDRAHNMAEIIPMGQPILVGHHSEGRDRRYRAKIDRTFRKSFAVNEEATDARRRATAAEHNDAISSDDPDAVDKLRAKLETVQNSRDLMVAANRAIRAARGDVEAAILALVVGLGFSEKVAREVMTPDPMGRVGFPSYALTNRSAEARRIALRITDLERRAAAPARAPVEGNGVRVSEAENRTRIEFPGKPSDAVRARLKSEGFKWAPSVGAWQRMASAYAWDLAIAYTKGGAP